MSLMRWEPFRDNDEFFGRSWPASVARMMRRMEGEADTAAASWTPGADISENEQEFTIRAELPGVKKDDVKITLDGGVIRISGERKDERKEKGTRFHRIESFHGVFSRSFTLPENVDTKAINADSEDGVLVVHLPKNTVEAAKPVEIKVK